MLMLYITAANTQMLFAAGKLESGLDKFSDWMMDIIPKVGLAVFLYGIAVWKFKNKEEGIEKMKWALGVVVLAMLATFFFDKAIEWFR